MENKFELQTTEQAMALRQQLKFASTAEPGDADYLPPEVVAEGVEALQGFMQKMAKPAPDEKTEREQLNFLERTGEAWDKRQMVMTDIMEATANGETEYAAAALQAVGNVGAGMVADFITEALVSGGRGLKMITHESIQKGVKDSAAWAGAAMMDTLGGQAAAAAAEAGMESWIKYKQENPDLARNYEALFNIAGVVIPFKGKVNPNSPMGVPSASPSWLGGKLRGSAEKSATAKKQRIVEEMVSPKSTVVANEAKVIGSETKGGFLNWGWSTTPAKLPSEVAAAKELMKLPGIEKSKNLSQASNQVWAEIVREAEKLTEVLKANDAPILKTELLQAINSDLAKLRTTYAVTGDAETAARSVLEKFLRNLNELPTSKATKVVVKDAAGNMTTKVRLQPGTSHVSAAEVFKLRKKMDMEFRQGGKPPNRLGEPGTTATGLGQAQHNIRNTINRVVDEATVGSGPAGQGAWLKESLAKQTGLYNALDSMVPKAAAEATSAIRQMYGRAKRILPHRGVANQLGAILLGAGGLGAGQIIAPFFSAAVIGGGLGWATYLGLSSPATRRGLASLLDLNKRAAVAAPHLARQFKADRVLLMNILKEQEKLMQSGVLDNYAPPQENIDKITDVWDAGKMERAAEYHRTRKANNVSTPEELRLQEKRRKEMFEEYRKEQEAKAIEELLKTNPELARQFSNPNFGRAWPAGSNPANGE